jgi:uncharacterized protein YacL
VHNDPKRFSKLKNYLEFEKSIAAIAVAGVQETTDALKPTDVEIRVLAPSTNAKLVANDMDLSKLATKEACSLLVTFYAVAEKLAGEEEEVMILWRN